MTKENLENSYLFAGNEKLIEKQYQAYLDNPASVTAPWRQYFNELSKAGSDSRAAQATRAAIAGAAHPAQSAAGVEAVVQKQAAVLQLANAYRSLGFRHAELDPLKLNEKPSVPELEPAFYGLTDADLSATFTVDGKAVSLAQLLADLKRTYSGSIGTEFAYMIDGEQKRWIQERLESVKATPSLSAEQKRGVLDRLTAAETLEKYLHTKFVGQKRFSLQGGDTLIPMLDALIQRAGSQKVEEVCVGMAHRGRLNVLVNIMGKQPCELFREFEGHHDNDHSTAGDVKYHKGFSTDLATPGGAVHAVLAFNPSHLEIVNPVVEGSVRARQDRRKDADGVQAMPVLIHGDAAFAGQGVVMETLNLAQVRGFKTGGTVHIVVNNQVGFTISDPRDARSTAYCTDVAKMIDAPIFHVNADDPEAVVLATEIALDYRMRFHNDVVIDLVCFRRLGHNESDEPSVTQPLMYKSVNKHPGTRKLYADRLVAEGVVAAADPDKMIADYRAALESCQLVSRPVLTDFKRNHAIDWTGYNTQPLSAPVDTAVPKAELVRLSKPLTEVPEGFKLHPRVEKIIEARRDMAAGKQPLDWGMAETLAYATLLQQGYGVRISGQDSGRGTFFHRHAVWHDQNRARRDVGNYVPLQHLSPTQPSFEVYDSVLSEEAVLGFEYGYATAEPNKLVIWEAQFGDFANGAQVVIDQFITSGEAKWSRFNHLVMMLPHGYEGQGPEHSSARLERYLQLCAEDNMRVVVPTTPANLYHLLRSQMVGTHRKPLVVMMPKSLLRHKDSVSTLDDLSNGQFLPVIGETEKLKDAQVKRVLVANGKVYYDLLAERKAKGATDVAIVRVEQLYPFPAKELAKELGRYKKAKDVVWVQDEPRNQGAWLQVQESVRECLAAGQSLSYAGRPSSASPAVGYAEKHAQQQRELIDAAFGIQAKK